MIDHQGSVALVTGGASGIGFALAEALTARGARIVVVDLDEAQAKAAAARLGGGAVGFAADLADPDACDAAIERAFALEGRLDLVCSNAGIARNRRTRKEAIDPSVERLFAVNLFAGLRLATAYLRRIESGGGRGRIMFTGSENSLSVPKAVRKAGLGLYGATKHGVLILAEWMREEWAEAPIDVHVLLPGGVYTPLIAAQVGPFESAPAEFALIRPERCAEIALKGLDLGLFYIPTHAHLEDDMRPRVEGVAATLRALGLR